MTQGLPPKPTCLSIVGGILLAVAILAVFAFLPNMVKWIGAAFTFVPSRLGLIQVVVPAEVMRVDVTDSPTLVTFAAPGRYALYTANLDLLAINESVLAAKAKPWFRLIGTGGGEVAISLTERGLAFYDTPLAAGRPVATFEIATPGTFTMMHPRRPDFVFIVPDYISGQERAITFLMVLQAAALVAAGWYVRKKTRKPLTRIVAPPPTRMNRERFTATQIEADPPARARAWRPWSADTALPDQLPEAAPDPNARDVLGMLQAGELTPAQAEAEVEALLLSQPRGARGEAWGAKLAFTPAEASAYSQGAGMNDLLNLRYEGWPASCIKCGQPIDHLKLRWLLVRDDRGKPALQHVECPLRLE